MQKNVIQRTMLLVVTNAGGEGKTWLSMLFASLMELMGGNVLTLDADPGNRAALSAGIGAKGIKDVETDASLQAPKILETLGNDRSLIVDCGANVFAVAKEFEHTMRDVGLELLDQGFNVVALWVLATNKLGAEKTTPQMAKRLSHPFRPVFVFNNRDGSSITPPDVPFGIKVPNLDPGLVVHVDDVGFTKIITEGLPGFQHSADKVTKYVWTFVDQPGVRQLLGDVNVDGLRQLLDRKTLDVSPYRLNKPVSDAGLAVMAHEARLVRCVRRNAPDIDKIIAELVAIRDSLV